MKGIPMKHFWNRAHENPILSYTLLGVFFGLGFPLSAIVFKFVEMRLPFSLANLVYIHQQTPLLYMIHTAPLFLGLFAFFVGLSRRKVMLLYRQQNEILTTDPLTGLKNRYACEQRIEEYGRLLKEGVCGLDVAVINVSNLKKINNLMGVSFGDQAMIMIARFLVEACPAPMGVYRISGNEFCILSPERGLLKVMQTIGLHFSQPVEIQGVFCLIKLFMGVCVSSGTCSKGEDILNKAYNAMNEHKRSQKDLYAIYTQDMQPTGELVMESKIFDALHKNEFVLVYQPVVDAKTRAVKGSEALLRWHSSNFGIVSPAIFIPFLENTHLIIEVGQWVLQEACRQTREWQQRLGDDSFFISINVSVSQLFDEDFLTKLEQMIAEIQIDKSSIRLEITESVSDEKREFIRDKIMLLGEHGFRLSIDDFGTGYSSLAELERMPLYSLKIDKSFVDRIGESAKQSHVIESVINMSHKMGITVVMEGVETQEQYQYLSGIDCDYIQGYFFSKPLYKKEFEEFVGLQTP